MGFGIACEDMDGPGYDRFELSAFRVKETERRIDAGSPAGLQKAGKQSNMNFTHFDQNGNALMVDVSDKQITDRTAVASGSIRMSPACYQMVKEGSVKKGDVLAVARVAGIMATKRTADLIPLCHPISLTSAAIEFECHDETADITVFCTAKTSGVTGVEMEALTGVQVALLTIYDMCKAVDRSMVMSEIHLVRKSGGKSGEFLFGEKK